SGLEDLFQLFSNQLGAGTNADELRQMFTDSYLNKVNLSDATRHLANRLFGEHGLVILDADHPNLKRQFTPFIKEELLNQTSFKCVTETIQKLHDYPIQVNPREINLFFLDAGIRERIIKQGNRFLVNNTDLEFSHDEIMQLSESNPEKFSPNVIMRPLYQEVILPNLCYIGGGGELAYWLELKEYFNQTKITFPILLLRNSAVLASAKQASKADKLNLKWSDLFSKQQDLLNRKIVDYSALELDFTEQKKFLNEQFEKLRIMASKTDYSFSGAVQAQAAKQIKGLENLEKRLLKAEKKKHAEELERIGKLQDELFPNQGLQERQVNFSEFYLLYGSGFIDQLVKRLKPLTHNFEVVVLE
ncbi:MAG TPA: bacillithiol biosynthesis cysteine-adding enzyme BshC, partial [Flavobacterium sp.]